MLAPTGLARWCAAILFFAFLIPGRLPAETNNVPGVYRANRYLFVVETSRAMQKRTDGMAHAVEELLASGFSGQFHAGDGIAVWTYDEAVHSGGIGLQEWKPANQREVAGRILGFLRAQKFGKAPSFDVLMPALQDVVRSSEFVTIVLVTTGTQEIHGTPYDASINEVFSLWQTRQQAARMPFVTVLRGQSGKLVAFTSNPVPWPLELPPLPPELSEPKPVPPPVVVATPKPVPAPRMLPPLIISGKKPEPKVEAKPAEAASPKPEPSTPVSPAAELAKPAVDPAPAPETALAPASAVPAPITPPPGTPASAAPVTPAVTPQASHPAESSGTGAAQPAVGAAATVGTAPPAPIPQPHREPVPASARVPEVKPSEGPSAPAAFEVQARTEPSSHAGLAAATPSATNWQTLALWVTSAGCVAALVLAGWLWQMRSRRGGRPSLITESLERNDREP